MLNRTNCRGLLLSLALCSLAPARLSAVTVQFPIVTDTYIDSQSPTAAYGSSGSVKVVVNGDDGSLVRGLFELPADIWSIPVEDLVSAKVWFWTFRDSTGDRTVRLHPLSGAFAEDGATWNTSDGSSAWSTPGGDYDTGPFVSAAEGANWFSWDITGLWDNVHLRSFGAMLKMDEETDPGAGNMPRAPFNSSDNSAERPYVEVTYVPEPVSLVGLGFSTALVMVRQRRRQTRSQ